MTPDEKYSPLHDDAPEAVEPPAEVVVTPNRWITSPQTRAYLYGIALAIVPLLTVLGVLSNEVGQHVLSIAAAVLAVGGLGLAAVNTPRKD